MAFFGAQLGEDQSLGRYLDACELQCAADILLLTSDYEGIPKVKLEAMEAGEPDMDNRVRDFVRQAAEADMRQAMKALAQSAIERTYHSRQFTRKPGTLGQ